MDRLQTIYRESIRPTLATELRLGNDLAVPAVQKVLVNVGLNQYRTDQKKVAQISKNLSTITGQKPSIRRSRKAVSSFKLRAGEPVGLSLTLRGKRMYDFLERFIRIALPRVRDFRGISRNSFDDRGNLTIGIKEMSVFPEIRYEDMDVAHGLEVTIVTSSTDDEAGAKLLKALGIPLVG